MFISGSVTCPSLGIYWVCLDLRCDVKCYEGCTEVVVFAFLELTEDTGTHIFNMVKSLQTEYYFIHKAVMFFFFKLFLL